MNKRAIQLWCYICRKDVYVRVGVGMPYSEGLGFPVVIEVTLHCVECDDGILSEDARLMFGYDK